MRNALRPTAASGSGRQPQRSHFRGVALDQFGKRLRRDDGQRRVEVAQAHGALTLLGEILQLPVNVHWIDIDQACLAADAPHALKREASETPRQDGPDKTCLLSGFAGSHVLRCEAADRVAFRNDPAATAAAGDEVDIHRAVGVQPDRESGDLVEHGRDPTENMIRPIMAAFSVTHPTYIGR